MLNRKISYDYDLLTDISKLQPFMEIEKHPEKLSNDHISKLGVIYKDTYLPSERRNFIANLFMPHTNHAVASELEHVEKASSYDRWMFLADIMGKLPNHRGRLAYTIVNLFIAGFQKNIYTFLRDSDDCPVALPKDLMIEQLKQIVNGHYLTKLNGLSEQLAELDKQNSIQHISTPR